MSTENAQTENIQPEAINVEQAAKPTTPPQEQPRVAIPETLTPNQALQILVDAARLSQQKGIFSLEDAELVSKAIRTFSAPPASSGPVPAS